MGPEIRGSGYSYNVPKGWGPSPRAIPGFDPDSFALDLQDRDGFSDNVNVIASPAGALTPAEAEEAAESELRAGGVTDISINDRVRVAGDESAHTTAVFSINAVKYTADQFYLTGDDQTFVVTFSFSLSVTPRERARVFDAVLATWQWDEQDT